MSYESQVFIIERYETDSGFVFGAEIFRFELCCVGYEYVNGRQFRDVFKTPIDFDLDLNVDEESDYYKPELYREDKYGAACKGATLSSVMDWLKHSDALSQRRVSLFYDFLKVLQSRANEYGELLLVHYGH